MATFVARGKQPAKLLGINEFLRCEARKIELEQLLKQSPVNKSALQGELDHCRETLDAHYRAKAARALAGTV